MSVPVLSVVVPCFNEEEVLPETAKRLGALLGALVADGRIRSSSQVCFVDDGSTDRTWAIVQTLHAADARMGGLRLSRNRGHQNALLAGLLTVPGDVVVTIDADLQDDLEAIRAMIQANAQGADIVYGVRSLRTTDTPAQAAYGAGLLSVARVVGGRRRVRSCRFPADEPAHDRGAADV